MTKRNIHLPALVLLLTLFTNTKLPADFLYLFPILLLLNLQNFHINRVVFSISCYAIVVTLSSSIFFFDFISFNSFIDIILVVIIPALFYTYFQSSQLDVYDAIDIFYFICFIFIIYATLQYFNFIPMDYILNEVPKETNKLVVLESEPAKSASRIMLMITMCEFISLTNFYKRKKVNLIVKCILIALLLLISSKTGLIFVTAILLLNLFYNIVFISKRGYIRRVMSSSILIFAIGWFAYHFEVYRYVEYVMQYLWLQGSFVSRVNYTLSGAYSLVFVPIGLGLNFNYLTATHFPGVVALTGLSNNEIIEMLEKVKMHQAGISANFWIQLMGFFGWLPGSVLIYTAFKKLKNAVNSRFLGLSFLVILSLSGVAFVPGTFLLLIYFLYMVLKICAANKIQSNL